MPISKVAQVTSSILLVLLVICRYDIGYDYHTYYSFVEDKNVELIEFLFSPFSAYLAYIAVYFDSPHLIFILFGIPTFVLILCGISNNSRNKLKRIDFRTKNIIDNTNNTLNFILCNQKKGNTIKAEE